MGYHVTHTIMMVQICVCEYWGCTCSCSEASRSPIAIQMDLSRGRSGSHEGRGSSGPSCCVRLKQAKASQDTPGNPYRSGSHRCSPGIPGYAWASQGFRRMSARVCQGMQAWPLVCPGARVSSVSLVVAGCRHFPFIATTARQNQVTRHTCHLAGGHLSEAAPGHPL